MLQVLLNRPVLGDRSHTGFCVFEQYSEIGQISIKPSQGFFPSDEVPNSFLEAQGGSRIRYGIECSVPVVVTRADHDGVYITAKGIERVTVQQLQDTTCNADRILACCKKYATQLEITRDRKEGHAV